MHPETVLVRADCDVKRLPLDALEAFLLSQLDGHLTLAEVGEIAGLAAERAASVAARLVDLGAATQVRRARVDPRAEVASTRRIDPRVEKVESRRRPSTSIQASKERRRSTRSLRAQRAPALAPPPPAKPIEACELDLETQERITALEALSTTGDFYRLLGVERDADKKDIKRAYFALAAKLHPDRFFGKKLGPIRTPLERLFVRLTEANDTLTTRTKREAYDATLPPAPRVSKRPPPAETPRPSKRPASVAETRATKAPPGARSTKMQATRSTKMPPAETKPRSTKMPPAPETKRRVSRLSPAARRSSRALRAATMQAKPAETQPEKFRRLQAAAKLLAAQTRAEPIVHAGEEALKRNDIIGAANSFRLALEIHDDPEVRRKLDAIDAHSRDLRHDASVARARTAERGERWAEAADHYVRANTVRASALAAERGAHALLRARGDLRLAASLAEQAVAAEEDNVDHRLTLAEVYLASGLAVRAAAAIADALARAPSHPGARALEAKIKAKS